MLNGSSIGEQTSEDGKHDPLTFDWNESLSSSEACESDLIVNVACLLINLHTSFMGWR